MSERRASARASAPPDRPRVLLAEEETLLRDALQGLLARDFSVVAAVPDLESMRREIVRLGPHVVVAGLSLLSARDGDEMHAFRVAAAPAVVVVVADRPPIETDDGRSTTPSGWVLRSSTADDLRAAVRAAAASRWLAPLPAEAPVSRPGRATGLGVTPRAAEVVRLIARGKVMREVAADLGISVRTVAFHKYKTMRSLGLDSTAALVRYAVRNSML